MLEAAGLGIPTVCFDRAGGAPEFCADGCGVVVPYLDIQVMGEAIRSLLAEPDLREQIGSAAREKLTCKYDINLVMPRWLDVMTGICDCQHTEIDDK